MATSQEVFNVKARLRAFQTRHNAYALVLSDDEIEEYIDMIHVLEMEVYHLSQWQHVHVQIDEPQVQDRALANCTVITSMTPHRLYQFDAEGNRKRIPDDIEGDATRCAERRREIDAYFKRFLVHYRGANGSINLRMARRNYEPFQELEELLVAHGGHSLLKESESLGDDVVSRVIDYTLQVLSNIAQINSHDFADYFFGALNFSLQHLYASKHFELEEKHIANALINSSKGDFLWSKDFNCVVLLGRTTSLPEKREANVLYLHQGPGGTFYVYTAYDTDAYTMNEASETLFKKTGLSFSAEHKIITEPEMINRVATFCGYTKAWQVQHSIEHLRRKVSPYVDIAALDQSKLHYPVTDSHYPNSDITVSKQLGGELRKSYLAQINQGKPKGRGTASGRRISFLATGSDMEIICSRLSSLSDDPGHSFEWKVRRQWDYLQVELRGCESDRSWFQKLTGAQTEKHISLEKRCASLKKAYPEILRAHLRPVEAVDVVLQQRPIHPKSAASTPVKNATDFHSHSNDHYVEANQALFHQKTKSQSEKYRSWLGSPSPVKVYQAPPEVVEDATEPNTPDSMVVVSPSKRSAVAPV